MSGRWRSVRRRWDRIIQTRRGSLNNLGALLKLQGDFAGARSYYQRALAICQKALGPDHPDTARSLNNLGALLRAQGDLAGAQPYYERALAINEKALGSGSSAHGAEPEQSRRSAVGTGRPCRGAAVLRARLAINEKALGPDHPTTALSLNNLGVLLLAQGDHAWGAAVL